MLHRFLAEAAHDTVHQFEIEARKHGAKFIEAEHMLLALASSSDSEAARLLEESGLDRERLATALHDERGRSLAFAGLQAPDVVVTQDATRLEGSLSLGTSAKVALVRALISSRNHRPRRSRLRGVDLLRGILLAEFGTVPRALAIAGVDRAALISRVKDAQS
jgi:ATP-dependent Clp protease ATP-binding subunit ClpA